MLKAIIHIGLKPGVLDPQGKAVADTLGRMGYSEVQSARIGKTVEIELDADIGADAAEARVTEMCDKLLANTVVETYRVEWVSA